MKYYGFMVSEFTGEVDTLECECAFKPNHETCGFSYAKWFTDIHKRDKIMNFTKGKIKEIRTKGNEISKKQLKICHKCGEEAYIKYGNHGVCKKHYSLAVNNTFNQVVKNNRKRMASIMGVVR